MRYASIERGLDAATVNAIPPPETRRLLRTVKKWRNEIEVLINTGATTAKV